MCILFIYSNPNPKVGEFRLIVASNRDEFYNRPSRNAFKDNHIIGGRDMEEGRTGGMWLGISTKRLDHAIFRLGALLNVTGEERKQGVQGRGPIVAEYLKSDVPCKEYVDSLHKQLYNAYNLVTVEMRTTGDISISHNSNVFKSHVELNGAQVLGFGNTSPTQPLTKVKNGCELFKSVVEKYGQIEDKQELINEILLLLKNDTKHLPDPELERRQPQALQYLSCIFVKVPNIDYGTRTHSVVLVDFDLNVDFLEKTMEEPIDPEHPVWVTTPFRTKL